MTDAQTFYLLLASFYLYECLGFAPHGARAFAGMGGNRWRWREPAFHLSGAHKDVFCAPVIPWPGIITVFPPSETSSTKHSPFALRHLQKRSQILGKITAPLRRSGLIVFLHYFVVLPYVYHFHYGSLWIFAAILAGEFLAVITGIRFYFLHRRLFPDLKGERRLETFFTAFFPWHAMRASDLIVKRMTANWLPLVCLVSDSRSRANSRELARLWRKAAYDGTSDELKELTALAGIDPSPWNLPPDLEADQQYCPVCHTIYEEGPGTCADCRKVPLTRPSS